MAGQPSAGADAVRTAEVMATTLCLATDLGMGFPLEHGLHGTLVAARLAERLGVDADTASATYYGSMLFYLGCTADAEVSAELFDEGVLLTHFIPVVFGRPQETVRGIVRALGDPGAPRVLRAAQGVSRLPGAARGHRRHMAAMCEVAQLLCDRLGVPPSVRDLFVDLPERWDGKGPGHRRGEQVPLAMRISQVARDAAFQHLVGGVDHARRTVAERSGLAFDPAVVAVLVDDPVGVLEVDGTVPVWDRVLAAEPGRPREVGGPQVDDALAAMADFADLVSPHLTGHSRGVAELVAAAAGRCGLSSAESVALRRWGLVHDLGRVAVHAGVWSRTGALSQDQWEQVRLHPYHSERVLSRSPGLSTLAGLCAGHHERLDGSGYHRGSSAAGLPAAARLLAAADVAHAMAEPRAHRPALTQPVGPRPAAKQVARTLAISPKTADRHVQNAYAKIGVSTRAAATVFAMQQGLVPWGQLPMSRAADPS